MSTTILSVATRSGSTYTCTSDGTMTVTRRPGHPFGPSTTVLVTEMRLSFRWSQSQNRYVRELLVRCPEGTQDFQTSELLPDSTIPGVMIEGLFWRPSSTPAQPGKAQSTKPFVDLNKAVVARPSGWTPPVSVRPEGVMAAMAVYGD